METCHPLGALKTFKLWNLGDGVTGVRPQITNSLQDQKVKLDMALDTALEGRTKSLMVAKQMLMDSHNFWLSLSHFIDTFYRELITSAYSSSNTPGGEEECWKLAMTMVRTFLKP